MIERELVLYGALVPGIATGLVLLLAWRHWRKGPCPPWCAPLAVCVGFLVARAGFNEWQWPPFPANTSEEWIPYLVVAGTLLALIPQPSRAGVVGRVVLSGLAPWLLFRNVSKEWTTADTLLHVGGVGAAWFLLWSLWGGLARRRGGITLPLLLVLVMTGAAVAFERMSSLTLARQAGVLAACFGAIAVLAWWKGREATILGAIAPAAMIFFGLLVNARFVLYTPLRPVATMLLAAAPVCAWIFEWKPLRERPPRQVFLGRLLVTAIPVAIAVWMAIQDAPEPNPYSDF